MKHSTLSSRSWLHAVLTLLLFAVAAAAHAYDFGATPVKFKSATLNGTYDVTFDLAVTTGFGVDVLNAADCKLLDAAGQAVRFAFVVPAMKDEQTASFSVAGADDAPDGTYTIKVPADAFHMPYFPITTTSDAFDITIVVGNDGGGNVDPDTPVDPSSGDNVATFEFGNYKGDASTYYHTDDYVKSNAKGVILNFDYVGMENDQYSFSYLTNAGFLQFKDCRFTISAPLDAHILKVEFVDGQPNSYIYDIENIEAAGMADGVWSGRASEVTFKTAVTEVPNYTEIETEDGEYEEVITGYSTIATGARVARIYVTLDCDVTRTDVPNSIARPTATTAATSIFDLAGRRVLSEQKGLNIVGGKKVIR